MSEQLATGDAVAPPTQGNTLAVVALAVGAGAAGAALLPFTGMIAAPLGAVALALGVVGIAEAGRRGRRGVAIAGTALGALALLAGVAWALAMFGGFSLFGMATGHSSDMGMAQESATLEAAPAPDVVAPGQPPPPPEREAGEHQPGPQEVHADEDEPAAVEDGTGQATVTLDGDTVELELTTCETGGRMDDRYLRGRGPDGRLAVDGDMHRVVLVVDTDEGRHALVGQRRGASSSGRGDEGVSFEATGEMTDVLAGDAVELELEAECS